MIPVQRGYRKTILKSWTPVVIISLMFELFDFVFETLKVSGAEEDISIRKAVNERRVLRNRVIHYPFEIVGASVGAMLGLDFQEHGASHVIGDAVRLGYQDT